MWTLAKYSIAPGKKRHEHVICTHLSNAWWVGLWLFSTSVSKLVSARDQAHGCGIPYALLRPNYYALQHRTGTNRPLEYPLMLQSMGCIWRPVYIYFLREISGTELLVIGHWTQEPTTYPLQQSRKRMAWPLAWMNKQRFVHFHVCRESTGIMTQNSRRQPIFTELSSSAHSNQPIWLFVVFIHGG